MYKVINEYMEKVNLQSNDEIINCFEEFLSDNKDVLKYTITMNFNRYIIDIRLKKYSVTKASEFFKKFDCAVAYPYSSLHIRFNEGKCVRYRYITCKENKEGYYCDIVIS